MTDAEDTATTAEGEHFVPYPVAVSLIADGMKLSRPEAERALEQLGRGRHVRVRGGEYHDTRFIGGPESTPIRKSEVRRIWQHASYALDDLHREIRNAQIPVESSGQQPALEEVTRASKKSPGRPLPDWKVEIIAAAAYRVIDLEDPKQADVANFIMKEAAETAGEADRSISPSRAKEYAAAVMRAHKKWVGQK
jgi:hypothetical protein